MLCAFRFFGAIERPEMERGQTGGPPRNGRIFEQREQCHHGDHLSGGNYNGKYRTIFVWFSFLFCGKSISITPPRLIVVVFSSPSICSVHYLRRPIRMAPNLIRKKMNRHLKLRGRICSSCTSCFCAFWNRPTFNQPLRNAILTSNLCCSYWNCSIRKILANAISWKLCCIEFTENSLAYGHLLENKLTTCSTGS